MSKKDAIFAKYCRGRNFPYHFRKEYEAVNNLETFKDRQKVRYDFEFPIENFIKYSFGLEFETSNGIIPEEICFADGLIPLRDGSISGNEYSTVVLQGHKGFNLLYQQLETLRKYTRFDKECSLHIHFGGFPLEPKRGAQFLTVMNGGKLIQECRWRDASNISHDLFVETKDGIFVYPKIQRHHQALYPWYTKHRVIAYSTNIKYYSERNGEIDYHLNYNKGNPEIVVYDNPEKPKCIAVQFLPTVYEEELLNYPLRVLAELINENTCR